MSNNDDKQTAKSALVNTIANLISLMIGVIMVPIISKVIPAEDLGVASIFVSTRTCLTIIIALASYEYVYRAMLEFSKNKKSYISSLVIGIIIMTIVAFFVCLPFKQSIQRMFSLDDFLFIWLFISAVVYALGLIGHHYCVYHNKIIMILLIVISIGPVSQILAVALAYVMPSHKYIGRVLGLDFSNVAITIALLSWLIYSAYKRKDVHPQISYVKRTLIFSIPIIPHLLSQMILTQSDLIMIGAFASSEKSGIFSMALTVGNLAYTMLIQVLTAWSPWVYRKLEEGNKEAVYNNSKIMIIIGGYLSIGLLTISTELIKIFLTDTYLPCIYIVPPLVLSMFFQFQYIFMYDMNYYYKKSVNILLPSIAASIINIVLNIILIPKFGYIAASYATLVSYGTLFVISYLSCRNLGVKKVYNIKYTLGSIAFLSIYTFATIYLADYIAIRYFILVVITIVIFALQYKKIIDMITMIKKGN